MVEHTGGALRLDRLYCPLDAALLTGVVMETFLHHEFNTAPTPLQSTEFCPVSITVHLMLHQHGPGVPTSELIHLWHSIQPKVLNTPPAK
jgi:hypothetical protein